MKFLPEVPTWIGPESALSRTRKPRLRFRVSLNRQAQGDGNAEDGGQDKRGVRAGAAGAGCCQRGTAGRRRGLRARPSGSAECRRSSAPSRASWRVSAPPRRREDPRHSPAPNRPPHGEAAPRGTKWGPLRRAPPATPTEVASSPGERPRPPPPGPARPRRPYLQRQVVDAAQAGLHQQLQQPQQRKQPKARQEPRTAGARGAEGPRGRHVCSSITSCFRSLQALPGLKGSGRRKRLDVGGRGGARQPAARAGGSAPAVPGRVGRRGAVPLAFPVRMSV